MPYKDPEKAKENRRKYYQKNRKEILKKAKEYSKRNEEKIKEYHNNWKKNNKDKVKQYQKKASKKWYEGNREEIRDKRIKWNKENKKYYRNYMREMRKDPLYKMSNNISRGIRQSLKSQGLSKNHRQWETMVGYTKQDLRDHLESLFTEGMTWNNQGKWHIDHIIPQSFFNLADNVEFKMCWRLENLQPLWALDNMSKGKSL